MIMSAGLLLLISLTRYRYATGKEQSHRCRAAATKVGGTGIRYTVSICGKQTYLFDEENGKWFVEFKTV